MKVADVAIVVPFYNNVAMTLKCVRALERARAFNTTKFTIVLVDDASTEDISGLYSTSAQIVRNGSNMGYLRSTNLGAGSASGEFIHLLNNDTEVIGSFLDPLVDLLERRPPAVIAGSRLVYPNGKLQEAGSIVFCDGTGWNVGRGQNPDHPFYTYERPVRYCSAASLLVRRSFWDSIGGFDERFVPAYYEDTDLAMSAWSRGHEVWYQPESVVVHHEGASHGTDPVQGVKTSQETNRQIFVSKWKGALAGFPPPSPENVTPNRAVRPNGNVLIVDHEVPTPDRDSGSLRITSVMELFLELGFSVTFCASNNVLPAAPRRHLGRLGVEVWGDPGTWRDHIRDMAPVTRLVWISRPGVMDGWYRFLRELLPGVPVVFDTVDLHSVRQRRQSEILGAGSLHGQQLVSEQHEVGLARSADAVVVVSREEGAFLLDRGVPSPLVIPNVHRTAPWIHRVGPPPPAALFVGGFRHPPNADAVEWFIREVHPLIRAQLPNFEFRVAGADISPELVDRFTVPGVSVLGYIADLRPVYASAGVVVAPLRFGAGVKGKVGEAMSHAVPLVATPVAVEGFDAFRSGLVADRPEAFAESVVRLLTDIDLWRSCADAGPHDIARQMGPDVVRRALAEELLPRLGVELRLSGLLAPR